MRKAGGHLRGSGLFVLQQGEPNGLFGHRKNSEFD